jgi:hypothetical protein
MGKIGRADPTQKDSGVAQEFPGRPHLQRTIPVDFDLPVIHTLDGIEARLTALNPPSNCFNTNHQPTASGERVLVHFDFGASNLG